MDSSESVIPLVQQNEELMEQLQVFREIIKQLTKENATVREQNTALTVQNSTYLELLQEKNHDTKSPTSVSGDNETTSIVEDLQQTIEALQERVIGLIQEKLSMQMFIEELEHQLAILSHPTTIPTSKSTKKRLDHEQITPQVALDDTGHQSECLETARRQQQEQLSWDDAYGSGRRMPAIDEHSFNPLLGEFDIRKELEERLHQRTTVGRPADGFIRSKSCPASSQNENHGVTISRFVGSGKNEPLTRSMQEAKEGNEKQRSRLWIGRIGFKGVPPEGLPTDVKPAQRELGNRRNKSSSAVMMECDDEAIERFNDRRESAAVPHVLGNLGMDDSGTNITESLTNLNLVL